MVSLDARAHFRQKDERHASEKRQPLLDFSRIVRSTPRQWTLPAADKHAKDSLSPPSGARLTMRVLDL